MFANGTRGTFDVCVSCSLSISIVGSFFRVRSKLRGSVPGSLLQDKSRVVALVRQCFNQPFSIVKVGDQKSIYGPFFNDG